MCVPLFSSDPRYAFVFHQVTFVWVLGNNSAQMSSSQNRGIQGKSCATQSCHDCVTMVLGKSGLLVADHASVNAFRVIIGEILTEKKVLATDQKKKEKKTVSIMYGPQGPNTVCQIRIRRGAVSGRHGA